MELFGVKEDCTLKIGKLMENGNYYETLILCVYNKGDFIFH